MKRILVIDDHEDNRKILNDLLASAGYWISHHAGPKTEGAAGTMIERPREHHATPHRCLMLRTRPTQGGENGGLQNLAGTSLSTPTFERRLSRA